MSHLSTNPQVVLIVLLALAPVQAEEASDPAEGSDGGAAIFRDYVQPLLKQHCLDCHSHETETAEGGLVLDSRNGWATGGSLGPAIVPGEPAKSWLLRAVEYEDENLQMPPDGKLAEADVRHLREWIESGAFDPRKGTAATVEEHAAGPDASKLWSVQPLAKPEVPSVDRRDWPQGGVDRFVLAALEEQGLEPSPDAPPHTLLLRLHDVLTGLPPTPDEAAAFVAAAERDLDSALAEKVDELLASPAFGERWGRHWLDVVRYADSPGTTNPRPYAQAWRFRNYVIDSFNEDKPFGQVVREHVAGDLLEQTDTRERVEGLVGTGFLALAHVPAADRDPERIKLDTINEQLDVVGKAFLGIHIGCARCHDHKLDPFPTRDYYALAGVLRSTETSKPLPLPRGPAGAELESWQRGRPKATLHASREAAIRDEPIHLRGDVEITGDVVPRGFPTLVASVKGPAIPADASGRRQLAEWLLDDNPLVDRVIVNRIWHHVFGRGIVRSTDNFGFTGNPPSHPELLDFLARRFRDEHGRSFKAMIRELVLSRTWSQASVVRDEGTAVDPENRLLWRTNLRRRDAETIVDSIRFVAGVLDRAPADRTVPDFRVGNQGSTSDLPIPADVLAKRAVYWPVFRKDVPVAMDVLAIFDFPPATAPRGTREVTRVPAQSLSLLNSPLVLDAARALSRVVRASGEDDVTRLCSLYRRLFARRPTSVESARDLAFLDRFEAELIEARAAKPKNARSVAWNRLGHALLVSNEFLTTE